ncbi:MAG: transposase [Gammaproteobacteria bacterium]|nr:transposase [Gammaproteobacteria bacterium]
MKGALQETCKMVSNRNEKFLSEKECLNLQKCYRGILTCGEEKLSEIPSKPNGQRVKMVKSEAHNLWERLKRQEQAVLLFTKDANVSFTNNCAEIDLRLAKVKQALTGCFRNSRCVYAYCRISSYL